MFDIGAIRYERLHLLGLPVDVVTPNSLSEGFRAVVLVEAVPVEPWPTTLDELSGAYPEGHRAH